MYRLQHLAIYGQPPCVFCSMILRQQDVASMEPMLGLATVLDKCTWVWNLREAASGRILSLTLRNVPMSSEAGIDSEQGALSCVVSVQTHQGYLELHDVTGYLCVEPDEVMFIAKHGDRFDSLVVGKTCTCSQFGNIQASLLHEDITLIDPSLLLAALQLGLAESMLESLSE